MVHPLSGTPYSQVVSLILYCTEYLLTVYHTLYGVLAGKLERARPVVLRAPLTSALPVDDFLADSKLLCAVLSCPL